MCKIVNGQFPMASLQYAFLLLAEAAEAAEALVAYFLVLAAAVVK
jgi:hypothetical protein